VTGWAGVVLRLNPMTPSSTPIASVLLRGELPACCRFADRGVLVALLGSVWLLFHRSEFQFAEYI
jgi:hypothetical protein